MQASNFIAGKWHAGAGENLISVNPATNAVIWEGSSSSKAQVDLAIKSARKCFDAWSKLTLDQRYAYLEKFAESLKKNEVNLAIALSQDTGKPLWEAKTEIAAMINKLPITLKAYTDRCSDLRSENQGVISITRHKPHGVVAVLGPFNFPAHIPNGHIMPALLAGNTVIFKPSELTPYISIKILQCWDEAGLPAGVINMLQGAGDIAQQITHHKDIDGIFFTGSTATGYRIQDTLAQFPQRILALEMGGNNPLVIHNPSNIDAAVYNIIQSGFITSGQRCTCARRLILTQSAINQQILERLIEVTNNIKIGAYTDNPEPFMGTVISNTAAEKAIAQYQTLIDNGAEIIIPMRRLDPQTAFVTPGIVDITNVKDRLDTEIFAPLLQVTWVNDFEEAIVEANNTSFGLAAGLLGGDNALYQKFFYAVRAGIVNWNRPLTGASSSAPFGGVGKSGNHRPSAYYAADYCAYPVASLEAEILELPSQISAGITL